GAAAARVTPPAAIQTRAVVARTAPPPEPVAFASQQKAIQSNGGRPLGTQEAQRLEPQNRPTAASVRVVQPAARPVPVERVAHNNLGQSGSNRPAPVLAQPAPNQPVQQTPQPQPRIRDDRPPSAQPNRPQPLTNSNEDRRPSSAQPNQTQSPHNPN